MKNNKIVIYIGLLAIGLLLGWLLFGGSSKQNTNHNHDAVTETNQMWTCSMHPQIMQPEPGDCPICGMDLIPAETSTNGLAANEFTMTKHAMALANIQTTIVGGNTSPTDGSIVVSGSIKENEEAAAVQPAHFDGRIEQLYVKTIGETVQKGQAVATIYSPALVSAQQELITAYRLKESQPKLYEAVRKKLRNWKVPESQLDKIERSPAAYSALLLSIRVYKGLVTELYVEEGAHIMDGKPIFKVSNLNTVWASFDVYENQISQIKKGQPIQITTNAYPRQTFTSTISFIDPVLHPQTRTVTVRATLSNTKDLFKPGMFVKGTIAETSTSNQTTTTLTIPASSVLWTGERSLVYVKTNDTPPAFTMREVMVGAQQGDQYQIVEGLTEGEVVVTNGTFTVDAAAQLQGKKSMMNENSTTASPTAMPSSMDMTLSTAVQQALQKSLPAYFTMKDALVAGKTQAAATAAKAMHTGLMQLDIKDSDAMMQQPIKKIKQLLQTIATSNTLEGQRNHFIGLNETLLPILKKMKDIPTPLFIQRCPMANSNKGASWLSTETTISNPYYGEAMLTCGSVIDTLQ